MRAILREHTVRVTLTASGLVAGAGAVVVYVLREVQAARLDAGSTTLLADAVQEQPQRDGAGFWWLAGESQSLIAPRRYLRRELGLPQDAVDCSGYWKRGAAEHDHHAPVDPGDPER